MPKYSVAIKGYFFSCWCGPDGEESLAPNPEWHQQSRSVLVIEAEDEADAMSQFCAATGVTGARADLWDVREDKAPDPAAEPETEEEDSGTDPDATPSDPASRESTLFTPPAAALAEAEAAELEDESRCSECGELGGHAEGCDVRSPSSSPAEDTDREE